MTQIQVDQVLQQKLGGLLEPLELRDSSGQIVGRYLPDAAYRKKVYDSIEIPFTEEELARRETETGGYTLEEIWKELGRQ